MIPPPTAHGGLRETCAAVMNRFNGEQDLLIVEDGHAVLAADGSQRQVVG